MGLRSLVFTSTGKVQSGWWHGWHEILSRALSEADSVCHRHTQRASSRECGGRPPPGVGGAASPRLNMGVGQGVNGFLIAAVESINHSVYIGFGPSVQHPATFLGVSLFI